MNQNKIAEVRKLVEQSHQSGKRPHYSDAIKMLAKSLLRDGVTYSELMGATGISRATLANRLARLIDKLEPECEF